MTKAFEGVKTGHIIKALERIDKEGYPAKRMADKYWLVYQGRAYPVKYPLSLAGYFRDHRFIRHYDFTTNQAQAVYTSLDNSLFRIVEGEDASQFELAQAVSEDLHLKYFDPAYIWVMFFETLSEKLLDFESQQSLLLEKLASMEVGSLVDRFKDGERIMEQIDPFTFFSFVTKYRRPEKLTELCEKLIDTFQLNCPVPQSFEGMPTVNAQKAWYVGFQKDRGEHDIVNLWGLFKESMGVEKKKNDTFGQCLRITNVGPAKLSQGIFYTNPTKYFPFNNPTREHIAKKGIQGDFMDWDSYLQAIEQVKAQFKKPLYQISRESVFAPATSIQKVSPMQKISLNQILYGPPGTGKTYATIAKAVQIVEELSDDEMLDTYGADRVKLKAAYQKHLDNQQIGFVTFHQSFAYEDFIEGIKPAISQVEGEEEVTELLYEIVPGIFKQMAHKANSYKEYNEEEDTTNMGIDEESFQKSTFYKISLGNTQRAGDEEIYRYCMDHGYIALGYGQHYDYSEKNEPEVYRLVREEGLDKYNARAMNYFKNRLKTDDYVVVSEGNFTVRAIGRVIGEYEYKPDAPIDYPHFRKVEWLLKDERIPAGEIYGRQLSQQAIYKLNKNGLKPEFLVAKESNEAIEQKRLHRNHVLIIDEINRGNVAEIFGELITLIEDDKRQGASEELSITLPYSKEPFSVPANLYLIGTMNTADRSVEALDSALRRRFYFEEMKPNPALLESHKMLWRLWLADWGYNWRDEYWQKREKGLLELLGGDVHDQEEYEKQEDLENRQEGLDRNVFDQSVTFSGLDLRKLLTAINQRIALLLDSDHCIGHSYFFSLIGAENGLKSLMEIFRNKIIPLLEEYFYGDLGKIGLILGPAFVKRVNIGTNMMPFPDYEGDVSDELYEKSMYEITNSKTWQLDDFIAIYSA